MNSPTSGALRFISWNVRGLGNPVKRAKVLSHLKSMQPDVIFLQETHAKRNIPSVLRANWLGQAYHANFGAKARGVAILFRKNVPFTHSTTIADTEGRYLILQGHLASTHVTLVNIYGPNFDSPEFFQKLFNRIPEVRSSHILIAGDANCVMDPVLDRSSSLPYSQSKAGGRLKVLLESSNIVDIWRLLNPSGREYSFFSPVHKSSSRIDYFFIDSKFLPAVTNSTYHPILVSDHSPVTLDLQFKDLENRNNRSWRFDPLLLKDEVFQKEMESHISLFLASNDNGEVDDSVLWESCKVVMRGHIIAHSSAKRKLQEASLRNIETNLKKLDKDYVDNPSPELLGKITKLRYDFNSILTKRVCSQLLSYRQQIFEIGDKPHKLLARLLKQSQASHSILSIKNKNGNLVTAPRDINSCFEEFYRDLYSSKTSSSQAVIDDFLRDCDLPSLDEEAVAALDANITLDEVKLAIAQSPNNKAPGPDGFGAEYYKAFATSLAPLMLRMFNNSKELGSMPAGSYLGRISLILKKDRDPELASSYRPISLLPVETKILSKILSSRLKEHITKIIHPDQTGFMPDRHIQFNMRRLFNIMYSPKRNSEDAIVISLDAQKAFDQVEHPYMLSVLAKFGFGEAFINWMQIIYREPTATVVTNRNESVPFRLFRGTRQGDPISPYIFALALEPLAARIRSNEAIHPIVQSGIPHKISAYADDVVLYISDPKSSIPPLLNLINDFGAFSGYRINWSKSELMPLSKLVDMAYLESTPFKIVLDKFKSLGIIVTSKFNQLLKLNWADKLNQLKSNIEFWKTLPISMAGRINAIKMVTLPRFLYIFQSLPVNIPQYYFKNLDSVITSFIWFGKTPRIRLAHLLKRKDEGGFGLPHFRLYYFAAHWNFIAHWYDCYFGCNTEHMPSWLRLEHLSCVNSSLPALLNAPVKFKKETYSCNPVIQSSLRVWSQLLTFIKAPKLYLHAPICGNHAFKPGLTDSAFRIWRDKGIDSLDNLYINDQFVSFQQLRDSFQLPPSHFFRFLQIRDFFRSHLNSFELKTRHPVMDCLMDILPFSKGAVSQVYSVLQDISSPSSSHLQLLWQTDLGIDIPDDMWEECIGNIHRSSINVRHSLIQFKIVHRLHFSPTKLHKIHNSSPMCCKCITEEGTLAHLFIHCHKLQSFWSQIFDFMSKAYQRDFPPEPLTALFGVVERGWAQNNCERQAVKLATLVARKLILQAWKSVNPPTVKMWIKELGNVIHLEKIRFVLSDREPQFYKIWSPLLSMIEGLR